MWEFYVQERQTFLSVIPRSHSIWSEFHPEFTWRTSICLEDQPLFAEQALRRVSAHDILPVQVARLYPAAEPMVYRWISDRYARARKIEKLSRHPYSHNASEVDKTIVYFRTFVDQFPQYGTRTLTRLIRDGNWKRVEAFSFGRYVDWKPHASTLVRDLNSMDSIGLEDIRKLMNCSNLWKVYLDEFFRGRKKEPWSGFFVALHCVPPQLSTYYQELAFKKGYISAAEQIARLHPTTPGPGRTLIDIHSAHAM